MEHRKKICIVSTVPVALRLFMREHIQELCKHYEVVLITNAGEEEIAGVYDPRVRFIPLAVERKISLLSDMKALSALLGIFNREQFDCVLSIMPKSGLLAMIAGFLARVPQRVHIFTGQVWFTRQGVARLGLKMMDRLLAMCATHLLADSPSQRAFLLEEGVVGKNKITVLGQGSISGVDTERFRPDLEARTRYRRELGIDSTAVVFLYMARVTRDKGVLDLAHAFQRVSPEMPDAYLVVIGPDEDGIEGELGELLSPCQSHVRRVQFTYDPEGYMAASDVFCIPSYREGFSSATIQAAGTGCPAIASRIYGLSDAVVEGHTGIFHKAGAVDEIVHALRTLYSDKDLRKLLGEQAYARAHQHFAQRLIVDEMMGFIRRRLT
ncbi:glycosyltransferase [Pseudomonas sp. CAM1A]|uniref:glycosyltransferase n=1 Tax=Pseudomonas sp. CAM1A TaxID=3231717 RepID=UPI0039C5BD87